MKRAGHRWSNRAACSIALLPLLAAPVQVGAQTISPPPERVRLDKNGVDIATQEPLIELNDVSIGPSAALGLSCNTTFSAFFLRACMSSGWESTYNTQLPTFINDSKIWFGNYSESFHWGRPANGGGSSSTLATYDGTHSYGTPNVILKDGSVITFGKTLSNVPIYADQIPFGVIGRTEFHVATQYDFPNGVQWTLHYRDDTSTGILRSRIQSVTSNTGYQLKFYYKNDSSSPGNANINAWGSITKVVAINNSVEYCSPDADSCALSQNWPFSLYSDGGANGEYRYVTDSSGAQTRFTYTSNSTIAVMHAGNSSDDIVYNAPWVSQRTTSLYPQFRKVTQATVGGIVTNYTYTGAQYPAYSVVATDALGGVTRFDGVDGGGSEVFTDQLNRVTNFSYEGSIPVRIRAITSPEGNQTTYVYDNNAGIPASTTRGNLTQITTIPKAGSGLSNLVESWVFPDCTGNTKTCNKATSHTDPKGAVTDYAYDINSGELLSEMKPAPTAGAARPLTLNTYAQRYAWIKDASGVLQQASTPVWLPATSTTCQTIAGGTTPICDSASPQTVTTFEYGAAGTSEALLVKGVAVTSGGVTLRTCYSYDIYHHKVSETAPRAGLGVCP